jgi:hypothetical protein
MGNGPAAVTTPAFEGTPHAMPKQNSTSLEAELIRTLREKLRLQTQKRKLKRHLKAVDQDLKFINKKLRALQGELEDRRPDVAPQRLFGNAVGLTPARRDGEQ